MARCGLHGLLYDVQEGPPEILDTFSFLPTEAASDGRPRAPRLIQRLHGSCLLQILFSDLSV